MGNVVKNNSNATGISPTLVCTQTGTTANPDTKRIINIETVLWLLSLINFLNKISPAASQTPCPIDGRATNR